MSLTNFIPNVTPITSVWLNGVDVTVNGVLQGAQTLAQAQAVLGITTPVMLPLLVTQGGTGGTSIQQAQTNLGLTQSGIGSIIYPQTPAETTANLGPVVPSNYSYQSGPLRYGAVGNGTTDDSAAWTKMGRISDLQNIPNLTYKIAAKVGVNGDFTWVGGSRTTCQFVAAMGSTADYVLEIGTNLIQSNVNGGGLSRMYFKGGTASQLAMLYMGPATGLWNITNLLFFYNGCPALVIAAGASDMFFDDLDIYGGFTGGTNPVNASVQCLGGANNLYFNNLHLEQCPSGGLYVDNETGPIHVSGGKLDQGFIAQTGDGIKIQPFGQLALTNFQITGVGGNVFGINCSGTLTMSQVYFGGGTGATAHITDTRVWQQINGTTFPSFEIEDFGPYIGLIDLGNTWFGYAINSIPAVTAAAITSKIANYRFVNNCSVTSLGGVSATSYTCVTNLPSTTNGTYIGCYLVYNTNGTAAGPQSAYSRRLIVASYSNQLVLQGNWAPALSTDCSIEYCAGHYTPLLNADSIQMDGDLQTLFPVLQTGLVINGTPFYTASNSGGGYAGCTTFNVTASNFPAGTDATGYYLIDETTGQSFLIAYGVDGAGNMAVPYSTFLNGNHTFSIVAGFYSNAKVVGPSVEWTYAGQKQTALVSQLQAGGFTVKNLPVWGFGSVPQIQYANTANSLGANYTAGILDANTKQLFNSTGTFTFTIPSNATVPYPLGTTLSIVNISSNSLTIAIATDTLSWYNGTTSVTGSRTLANGGIATATKANTTSWVITGTGLT